MQPSDVFTIPEDATPDRADRVLAEHLPGKQTRSALARLMRMGGVRVEGRPVRPSTVLNPGDRVEFLSDSSPAPEEAEKPQLPNFRIIMEDDDVLVGGG